MSFMRECLLVLLLTLLFLLFASVHPVCSLALNLPEDYGESDGISKGVELQPNDAELPTDPISTAPPPANASESNASGTDEQRKAMLQSIQQHILAKLNLRELPEDVSSNSDTVIPAALMASYYAHLQALEHGTDAQGECSEEETTHFSRHTKLYHPEHYVSAEPNSNHFQLNSEDDEKSEEVKDPNKDKKDDSDDYTSQTSKSLKNASPVSPVLYNLRFEELDFSDSDRIWSLKLQLYKRKAPLEINSRRGTNPVETVKVFKILRTYAYGQSRKRYVLLASKNVRSEDEGYVSFNITSGVKNWLMSSSEETTLELDIKIDTPQRVDTGLSLPPAITFDIPNQLKGEHNARLLMERLNENERIGANHGHDRLYGRRKRQTVQGVNNEYCYNNPNETQCCIKNLTVSFQELGLSSIIFPPSFQPNYCKGQCKLKTASATMSTSFLMQLRDSNPTAAAEPCCVAHKTRPLTVFMKLNGKVVLNDIPDMIVDSCICR